MEENAFFLKYLAWIREDYRPEFSAFQEFLLSENNKYNLTAITDEKQILYKHFLDSLTGEKYFPKGAEVCEVGSGAGFPSIPLKIARRDLRFTLIESVKKKCEFLKQAVERLNLNEMRVECLRAEEAGRIAEYRETFDVCCARAVARLNTLSEYCLPLVKRGGRMIAYKGEAEKEVEEAKRAIALLGGTIEWVDTFQLPEGAGERTLIVIKKTGITPEKYPRGNGKERSDPLGRKR